ncbi:terminase [Aeromonas sp. MaB10011B]|uniref:phage terminase small subunit n=1 Tax=unclassified Aeromonas TaxID=257493 RepID=UPI001B33F6D1|nr:MULTISPECIES: phage terminase small subunit [unclassified Aeromonas]MBP4067099.1 terminase [Aeromonas sp. MaB10011B]MBP4078497.1 terminase [Aeromonas sp. MrichA-1]
MTSPARRNRERKLAALQGSANPQFDQMRANAYELQLMQLAEHRRTLKSIQSIERKIDAKRTMLPVYKPWIDGLLAADRGGQDDVLVTIMLWTLDTGDLTGALPMADYVIRHGLSTPDRYERTAATLIAEEVADTGIKLQEAGAGAGPSLGLLCAYLELLTHCDIFDQVRAKLHKAVGRAALAEGFKEQAAEHYQRAIELHDKVGIKKELEVLEREIKKQKAAELPVASDVSAASVTAPANAEASQEQATEQQGPAPGEAS